MNVRASKGPQSFDQHVRQLVRLMELNRYHFDRPGAFERLVDDILCEAGGKHERPLEGKERDAVKEIASAYGAAVRGLPPFTDILGPVYEALGHGGNRSGVGQFFTPSHVADLLVALTQDQTDFSEPVSVMEPCVGAGAMLLAACRRALELGDREGLKNLHIRGIDLSVTALKIAAAQFVANNCFGHSPGSIHLFQGNALQPDDARPFYSQIHPKQKPCRKLPMVDRTVHRKVVGLQLDSLDRVAS